MNAEEWIQEYINTDGHVDPIEILTEMERLRVFALVTRLKAVVDDQLTNYNQFIPRPKTDFVNIRHLWVHYRGAIPRDHWVIKACQDADPCWNPAHYRLQKQESGRFQFRDPGLKRRVAEEIVKIRELHKTYTNAGVASIFEVSTATISNIVHRDSRR